VYYLLAFAFGIGAVAFYLFLCGLVLIYVAVPASLVAVAVGGLGGVGTALVLTTLTLAGRYPARRVIGPDDVVRGTVGGPKRPGLPRRDWAWPTYFASQVRYDLGDAARWVAGWVRRCWALWLPVFRTTKGWVWLAWPLLLVPLALAAAVTAGGLAGITLVAVVFAAATAAAWAGGVPVVWALRGLDLGWQRVFRSAGSCPRAECWMVSPLPAYRCPNQACARLHRDIRPGRLGVLWRRCGCGERMPTTVLRSRRLRAACPWCEGPLYPGAAVATDIRIPVFGAPAAGKTRFVIAALVSLHRFGAREGVRVRFLGADGRQTYEEYLEIVTARRPTIKTADVPLPPVSVEVVRQRRSALVHLFDAAGERYLDREKNARLAYLDQARTLVFVLDPFSVPDVRARLAGSLAEVFAEAARHDPEDSYHVTVQRLRSHGLDTTRQRLAFVVSKADLLLPTPVGVGLGTANEQVRSFLVRAGLENLVLAAARDFGEVRFFLVSALEPDTATDPLGPLMWLFGGEPIPLRARAAV
jgi:hypothetical protein